MVDKQQGSDTNPLALIKAVLWSFLGIRRKKDYAQDAMTLKPHQVIIAGVIGAAVFVVTLILIVRLIVSH